MDGAWRIELLGGLRASRGDQAVRRFRTQKAGLLLAYLAFYLRRSHPREALIEMLWPEGDPAVTRRRLRVLLSSLRRQLEPPGVALGAVLVADYSAVQLNADAVTTDVAAFDAALREASASDAASGQRELRLIDAVTLYQGDLLPGSFEEWVLMERERLAEAHLQAVTALSEIREQAGDLPGALRWARGAAAADPLNEEVCQRLIRLFAASGRHDAARREFDALERRMARDLAAEPSPETRLLGERARRPERATSPMPAFSVAGSGPTAGGRDGGSSSALLPGTLTFLALDPGSDRRRGQITRAGGRLLPSSQGPLLAAFARASEALAALKRTPLSTDSAPRIALYTSEVAVGGEAADCPALDDVRLLLWAAHPGQALVSEQCAALLAGSTPRNLHLVDLGLYRLRPGGRPGRVFQLCDSSRPSSRFPPIGAERVVLHSLPLPLDRFFGREREIRQILAHLQGAAVEDAADHEPGEGADRSARVTRRQGFSSRAGAPPAACRLLTLTGPGGSGKTRLAIEVVRHMAGLDGRPTYCVRLADLTDPGQITAAIRDELGLPSVDIGDPFEQIATALGRQPTLLVLDNFEHLLAAPHLQRGVGTPTQDSSEALDGAVLLLRLLERVPTLQCLVTSRRRLDLAGEQEFLVGPLPVPGVGCLALGVGSWGLGVRAGKSEDPTPNTQDPTPSTLMECPSVALFVDRARAVRPDLRLTPASGVAVAALCRRLEGIPLALELAAARAGVMTPAQILERLESRLNLLVSRQKETTPRHRTLRSAIEWSYQLLSPELRRFFARLSIFQGGWTLDAAERVCADGEQPAQPDTLTLDYLEQLRASSLLLADASEEGALRFRMLETLREYAGEQLSPAERRLIEQRHARYYLAFAEIAEPELMGREQQRWLDRLEAEHDNLRAVLAWSRTESGDLATGLRLAGALMWFWTTRGYYAEARAWLKGALAAADQAPPSARARAEATAANLAYHQGDLKVARPLMEANIAAWRELGEPGRLAYALRALGWAALAQDDEGVGRAAVEESLEIYRGLEDSDGIARSLNFLGHAVCLSGDHEAARARWEESLQLAEETGDDWLAAWVLNNLGKVAERQGDFDTAHSFFERGLSLRLKIQDKRGLPGSLDSLAGLACRRGEVQRGVRLFGAAAAGRETYGASLLSYADWGNDRERDVAAARAALGEAAFAAAWSQGRAMSPEEALVEAGIPGAGRIPVPHSHG
jgi:predicted ATPase/DNA-binding SARP family transcriptional activator